MWFKNIQVYRFTQPVNFTAEELAEQLQQHEFTPCDSQQPVSSGWTPPLGRHGSDFVHATNGNIMICSKTQEKLLPAAVINEELEEKVLEIEEAQSRKVSRKERTTLKEEITFSLLPMAFVRSRLEYAYISTQEGLLVLNSSSEKKADEFVSNLRKAVGSLPVVPLECNKDSLQLMTDWVTSGKPTHGFELGEECELRFDTDIARLIKCKNQDLRADEIMGHLKTGMHVTKLALSWNDRLEFLLDEKLMIKRIRFTDVFQEEVRDNAGDAEDKASQFDIEFSIMTLEYAQLINAVVGALEGMRAVESSGSDGSEKSALEQSSDDDSKQVQAAAEHEVEPA